MLDTQLRQLRDTSGLIVIYFIYDIIYVDEYKVLVNSQFYEIIVGVMVPRNMGKGTKRIIDAGLHYDVQVLFF